MPISRRLFLAGAAAAAAPASMACRRTSERPALPEQTPCGADLAKGSLLGLLPFVGEGDQVLEQRTGTGLDARYYVDLTGVGPDALVMPAERFYLRTGAPEGLGDPADWAITLGGLVQAERTLSLDELRMQVEPMGLLHFECSGNGNAAHYGLMSAGDFDGVPLSWVLSQAEPLPEGALIEVVGHDEHPPSTFSTEGACWVFYPEDLQDAWLVTHQDGLPLVPDHGGPVRLLVPGWYGCCNLKWVEQIRWVSLDAPASTQMREFARRTHQAGEPELARDYAPAEIQTAAVAVRAEAWELDGERVVRVIGVVWGGKAQPTALHLWMDDEDLGPVELCPRPALGTWGLWQAVLPAGVQGVVRLRCEARGVPARRLSQRWYDRLLDLGEA